MNHDTALLHTTASLLRASGKLLPFHLLLAALGAWRASAALTLGAWLLITLALAWLHWRIAFDAAIFRRWQDTPDSAAFDQALHTLKLRRLPPSPPTLASRCRGATCLCMRLLAMTLLQGVFTAVVLVGH